MTCQWTIPAFRILPPQKPSSGYQIYKPPPLSPARIPSHNFERQEQEQESSIRFTTRKDKVKEGSGSIDRSRSDSECKEAEEKQSGVGAAELIEPKVYVPVDNGVLEAYFQTYRYMGGGRRR
ncbi:hypothetical protein WAI453_006850 [Rhynchosporium graminicola]